MNIKELLRRASKRTCNITTTHIAYAADYIEKLEKSHKRLSDLLDKHYVDENNNEVQDLLAALTELNQAYKTARTAAAGYAAGQAPGGCKALLMRAEQIYSEIKLPPGVL